MVSLWSISALRHHPSLSFEVGGQLMGYLTHLLWPFLARNGLRRCKGDPRKQVPKFPPKRLRIRPENTEQHTRGSVKLFMHRQVCTDSHPVGNKNVIINYGPSESDLARV